MSKFKILKFQSQRQAGSRAALKHFPKPPRLHKVNFISNLLQNIFIHIFFSQPKHLTPLLYYYTSPLQKALRIVTFFLFILSYIILTSTSCPAPQTIHKDITFIQSWTTYIYSYNDSTQLYHILPPQRKLQLQFDQRLSSTPAENSPGFELPAAATLIDSFSFTPQDAEISYTPDTSATVHYTFNIFLIPAKYFITIRAKGTNDKYSRFSSPYYFTLESFPPYTPVRIQLLILPR